MKKAKVMYIPAGGKKAVWGPVDQNVLPEGYPYKEQSETVVFPEQTVTGEVFPGLFNAQIELNADVVDGEIYTVVLNGVEYETKCENGMLGDWMGYAQGGLEEEIPFYCSSGHIWVHESVGNPFTLSIFQRSETIHPMSEEFLPTLTSPNGTKYKLTVADDGTLSAVAVS